MEVKANAKFIRMSPKKIRLIADLIRGMNVKTAEAQLKFKVKLAAGPVLKLLKSAVANALHNFNLKEENLFIKTIAVNEGPSLKRWAPKAFGRATPVIKRSAHVNIVLDEKIPGTAIKTESLKESALKTKKKEEPIKKYKTNRTNKSNKSD